MVDYQFPSRVITVGNSFYFGIPKRVARTHKLKNGLIIDIKFDPKKIIGKELADVEKINIVMPEEIEASSKELTFKVDDKNKEDQPV